MADTNTDTICAISTAPGVGGIAVCRVSGPQAIAIVGSIWQGKPLDQAASHSAHFGAIVDGDSQLDQAVATIFRGPRSYTGEDVVEISVHGSTYVQQRLLEVLIAAGCRLAQPGEYTRRAFTNGRLDLTQAEAVADIIAAQTQAQHRAALRQINGSITQQMERLRSQLIDLAALLELELDFSEEDVEFASRQKLKTLTQQALDFTESLLDTFRAGNALRQGIPVAIVGPTNAGKSSLLNALLGHDRAIVSDIHGTTRDTVEETAIINGHLFRFIDTAGLRQTTDTIEALGIERSRQAMAKAAIILNVSALDTPGQPSADIANAAGADALVIDVVNKIDLGDSHAANAAAHRISAKTGAGIPALRDALAAYAAAETAATDGAPIITNARHADELRQAADALRRTAQALDLAIPADLVAQDLRQALYHIGAITGAITPPDILNTIFAHHCIGK